MLQGFHDFDFIQRFDPIWFFVNLNELRRQQMFGALLATLLHFAEFASRGTRRSTRERDEEEEEEETCRETPSVRNHR